MKILFFSLKTQDLGRKKREAIDEPFQQRAKILNKVEKAIPYLFDLPSGTTGRDCLLKTICEAARTPCHRDGLLGDFINLMLVPSHNLDQFAGQNNTSDYLEAQSRGHFFEDCTKYSLNCPLSFFEVSPLIYNSVHINESKVLYKTEVI